MILPPTTEISHQHNDVTNITVTRCDVFDWLQLHFWLGEIFPIGTGLKTEISVYDLKKMEEWILKDETFPLYIEAVQNTLEDILKT